VSNNKNGFTRLEKIHSVREDSSLTGFTLIEVVLSIAIVSILGGVVALLSASIIESWSYTENRLALQKASSDIMDELIQGGFEATGIRDAADFVSCGEDSITFVPLWVDDSHQPDPVKNKTQKFTLNRQFKVGSSVPLAQTQEPDSLDWVTASVKFKYGKSNAKGQLDDVVQVIEPIPYGSKIKFTFTPDPKFYQDTQKSFVWNQGDKHIYKIYRGEKEDMLKTISGVRVEQLRFIYFDNLNQEIPLSAEGYLTTAQINRATAVKIYLLLSLKGDWREAVSYVNVRSTTGTGVSIIEGSMVPLPSSDRIRALSIGSFYQRKRDGIVRLVIRPKNYRELVIQLKIIPDPSSSERLKVERFQIESPSGKLLASSFLNQTFMWDEFVSLMAIDRTGLYDYDDDQGVDDFYIAEEEPVFLEVERLDFDGASLFIKP